MLQYRGGRVYVNVITSCVAKTYEILSRWQYVFFFFRNETRPVTGLAQWSQETDTPSRHHAIQTNTHAHIHTRALCTQTHMHMLTDKHTDVNKLMYTNTKKHSVHIELYYATVQHQFVPFNVRMLFFIFVGL